MTAVARGIWGLDVDESKNRWGITSRITNPPQFIPVNLHDSQRVMDGVLARKFWDVPEMELGQRCPGHGAQFGHNDRNFTISLGNLPQKKQYRKTGPKTHRNVDFCSFMMFYSKVLT
jgi:hypothetical protein